MGIRVTFRIRQNLFRKVINMGDTDKAWSKWGATDPYFGVLSSDQFRKDRLSPETRAAFFKTGEEHIGRVIEAIDRHLSPGFRPRKSLDFGCGVGRLVIPLARICEQVVGVDIADAMLAETRRNCEAFGLANVELVKSDDDLSRVSGAFDLIHTYIVLQHISPDRGERLCAHLMDKTAPGGVIVLHFDYRTTASKVSRAIVRMRYEIPLFNWARNVLRGVAADEPPMERNVYELSTILEHLQNRSFDGVYLKTSFDGQFHSVTVFAQRR